jgi:hypothetical protein
MDSLTVTRKIGVFYLDFARTQKILKFCLCIIGPFAFAATHAPTLITKAKAKSKPVYDVM